MRAFGIRARLAAAIALAALIPVAAAMVFARVVVQQSSERYFVPEIREHLDRALQVYGELAKVTKVAMRNEAELLTTDLALRSAVMARDKRLIEKRLQQLLPSHPALVSLQVLDAEGEVQAAADRGRPVDERTEKQLNVVIPLLQSSAGTPAAAVTQVTPDTLVGAEPLGTVSAELGLSASAEPGLTAAVGSPPERLGAPSEAATLESTAGPELIALFAVSRTRFDEFAAMGEFLDLYSKIEQRRGLDERTYLLALATILAGTIVLAVGAGALVSRSVVRRISALAGATHRVAAGDLSIRVADVPHDEVGALGAAFNRMLSEVEVSRNRIEYLSRLASWQEMARRLAHEIKNPLTPIQLAVQEVHRRLIDVPEEHRKLLDVALEIVEAEVGTLRRLVTEFSQFARLPESRMIAGDLRQFLEELEREVSARGDLYLDLEPEQLRPALKLSFTLLEGAAPLAFDVQMLRRVVVNLIRNAAQACGPDAGQIRVSLSRVGSGYELCVDDDGPGVPPASRSQIFEPYVTTKDDGTGLGLAIVKKIVMDHQGDVEMLQGPLGGARVRITLPSIRTA